MRNILNLTKMGEIYEGVSTQYNPLVLDKLQYYDRIKDDKNRLNFVVRLEQEIQTLVQVKRLIDGFNQSFQSLDADLAESEYLVEKATEAESLFLQIALELTEENTRLYQEITRLKALKNA